MQRFSVLVSHVVLLHECLTDFPADLLWWLFLYQNMFR